MHPNDTTQIHPQFKNRVGQRFGRLFVVEQAECPPSRSRKATFWRCRCDCGNMIDVSVDSLRRGDTQSCGCLRKELVAQKNEKHGMKNAPLYSTWRGMIQRCTDTNADNYPRYGGIGIAVCDEWRHDFKSFHDYVTSLHNHGVKGYTLDRIDNSLGYFPDNVQWSSPAEQARNQRNNYMITYDGKTQCLKDWATDLGVNRMTISSRLRKGWDVERAFTTPVGPNRNPHSRQRAT